jgi:hypothetical protein
MPAGNKSYSAQKATFSAETVAVALLAKSGGGPVTISDKQYEMMSALDGTRSKHSFQHQFRPVMKLVKELQKRREEGDKFESVVKGRKRGILQLPLSIFVHFVVIVVWFQLRLAYSHMLISY